jgi:hypothetical protein
MRNLSLAITITFLLLGVNILTTNAQELQQRLVEVEQTKIKSKGNVVRIVNKSKPLLNAALAELQTVFAARIEAYAKKDYDTLVSQISPDFSAALPNGQTLNYEQIKTYMRRNLDRFISIESQSITIENAMVNGNEAVIDARQTVSRTQKFADGSVHNVVTSVLQQETWVKTANGWKLKSVGSEREQSTLVDGKPLNPNKP